MNPSKHVGYFGAGPQRQYPDSGEQDREEGNLFRFMTLIYGVAFPAIITFSLKR